MYSPIYWIADCYTTGGHLLHVNYVDIPFPEDFAHVEYFCCLAQNSAYSLPKKKNNNK